MHQKTQIYYQGAKIDISITENNGEKRYIIHFPKKDYEIYLKEDNEGASYWFEAGTDNVTELSEEIGLLIEEKL